MVDVNIIKDLFLSFERIPVLGIHLASTIFKIDQFVGEQGSMTMASE